MSTPARYRRRPHEVEAIQYTGTNGLDICRWAYAAYDPEVDFENEDIPIGDGGERGSGLSVLVPYPGARDIEEKYAFPGYWVTRDAAGNYDVLSAEDFDLEYEAVL
jgi:hypothetical protein